MTPRAKLATLLQWGGAGGGFRLANGFRALITSGPQLTLFESAASTQPIIEEEARK
jgi:hypothetical protein